MRIFTCVNLSLEELKEEVNETLFKLCLRIALQFELLCKQVDRWCQNHLYYYTIYFQISNIKEQLKYKLTYMKLLYTHLKSHINILISIKKY